MRALLIASYVACAAAWTAPRPGQRVRAALSRYAAPPLSPPVAAPPALRRNSSAYAPPRRLVASVADRPTDEAVSLDPVGAEANNVINLQPPALGDGKKAPSEFELNLGEAIDALRADVPDFADRELKWDIYTPDVQLADPTGVQTRGLQGYKQFFGLIRMFRRVMIDDVDVTFKLRYDWSGKKIVVTWYSEWTARGSRTAAHVDAVSYFHLDDKGKVFKHEVDRVQVGGRPLSPPYSVGWLAFREYVLAGLDPAGGRRTAPAFFKAAAVDAEGVAAFVAAADAFSEGVPALASATGAGADAEAPAKEKKAEAKKRPRRRAPGTCENMWDCDSPMECCDFVMFKMCCRGGVGIPAFLQPQPVYVPIPIPVENDPRPPHLR